MGADDAGLVILFIIFYNDRQCLTIPWNPRENETRPETGRDLRSYTILWREYLSPEEPMKRLLVSILITAAIILFLLGQISLKELYRLLISVDPLWSLLGALSYVAAVLFRGLRYRWLIHSRDVSLPQLFRIAMLYNLSITVLPSKLGELSYPYLLNRFCRISMTEGLASLIAARVYDLFIMLGFFLVTSMGSQSVFKVSLPWILLTAVVLIVVMLLAFLHLGDLSRWFSNGLRKISERVGPRAVRPLQWAQQKLHQISADFDAIHARQAYLPVAIFSALSWIMVFLMFYAFLKGFGVSVPFLKVVFGSTMALLVSTLPISGLGNWGTLEAGWTAGFLLIGLSKTAAIATGFGAHILVLIVNAVMGFFCWMTLKQESPPPPAS